MPRMNGSPERRIEIFAPFNAALELTKRILLEPFDLRKWFVIGFAAFLSHLAGGGGSGFNFRIPGGGDWKTSYHSAASGVAGTAGDALPAWVFPLIAVGGLLVLVIALLCLWIGSRGKFIFIDCIVRNRAAIVEPWHEFRREGNSYFGFLVIVITSVLVIVGVAGSPLWLPAALHGRPPEGVELVVGALLLFGVLFALLIALSLLAAFMQPIMYRRRCGASAAFRASLGAIAAEPGPVLLYLLFSWVLSLAMMLVACLATCATCCLTAIPYLGTVILLPIFVFGTGYTLLFVRQFGADFDPWASFVVAEPAPPLEPPPVQT